MLVEEFSSSIWRRNSMMLAVTLIYLFVVIEAEDLTIDKFFTTHVIQCPVTPTTKWFSPYGQLIESNSNFKPTDTNLTIIKITEYHVGKYFCLVGDRNYTVHVKSRPILKNLDKSLNVVHGNSVNLTCHAYGHPKVEFAWYRVKDSGDELVTIGDTLFINQTNKDDYGLYKCVASNDVGNTTGTIKIRVKDKLAPLWPFIGIVAEVLILIIIIVIYEKRKSKLDVDDVSKNDSNKITDASGAENVRQRK